MSAYTAQQGGGADARHVRGGRRAACAKGRAAGLPEHVASGGSTRVVVVPPPPPRADPEGT